MSKAKKETAITHVAKSFRSEAVSFGLRAGYQTRKRTFRYVDEWYELRSPKGTVAAGWSLVR